MFTCIGSASYTSCSRWHCDCINFPKQFTVGVLNATLDLAALVLVGVAAFLGSEAVLAPLRSLHVGCLNCLGSTLVFFLLYIITVEWLCACYDRDRKKTVGPNHTLALSAGFQILLGCSVWGWRRGLACENEDCQQHDPLKKMFSSSGKQCVAVPYSVFSDDFASIYEIIVCQWWQEKNQNLRWCAAVCIAHVVSSGTLFCDRVFPVFPWNCNRRRWYFSWLFCQFLDHGCIALWTSQPKGRAVLACGDPIDKGVSGCVDFVWKGGVTHQVANGSSTVVQIQWNPRIYQGSSIWANL